jgi:hypothetical protein
MAEGLVSAEGFAVDASLIPADASKQHAAPSSDWMPQEITEEACRAMREYLATLDDAAFGAATTVTPKFVSLSNPAAQWTAALKGAAFFSYSTNYLIDTDHGAVRASQAHPATPWSIRRQGRVPARRDRAKPAAPRPVAASGAADGGGGGIARR